MLNSEYNYERSVVRYTLDLPVSTAEALKRKADKDYMTVPGEIRHAVSLNLQRDRIVEGFLVGEIKADEFRSKMIELILSA